jgi:hypothetical protein
MMLNAFCGFVVNESHRVNYFMLILRLSRSAVLECCRAGFHPFRDHDSLNLLRSSLKHKNGEINYAEEREGEEEESIIRVSSRYLILLEPFLAAPINLRQVLFAFNYQLITRS